MTDGTVGVANLTGSTTKKVDVSEVTVGSNTVERQRVVLADNTSNNYAVIDASGFLSVNLAGAISLPTGAATAAKQPALGTAGTASADVLTVQGIASMTALLVAGGVASGAADSGNPVKVGGAYNSTPITLTNGQRGDLQVNAKGYTRVEIGDATGAVAVTSSHVDGGSNSVPGLAVRAYGVTFNGTTWDRMLSVVNATNSVGTGVQAVGNLAQFDDVAPTSITENQFGNLRMSANRNLYGTIRDAAGNERGVNVSAGNALLVDASATTQPVSLATNQPAGNVASGAADSGNPLKVAGKYTAAGVTLTDGNRGDLQLGQKGSLYVSLRGQDTTTTADIANYNADGNSAASFGGLQVVSVQAQFNGSTFDRSRSVVNATNSTGTGIQAVGLVAQVDDTSPTAISENQFGNVRMTALRALSVSAKPDTLGGLTPARVITGTTGAIKASAGQGYRIWAMSTNAAVRYLHIYNKATAPTLSTDTPVMSFPLLQNAPQNIDLGGDLGTAFATGIAWAYTTDNIAIPATAGTSAELQMTMLYN